MLFFCFFFSYSILSFVDTNASHRYTNNLLDMIKMLFIGKEERRSFKMLIMYVIAIQLKPIILCVRLSY